jgi:hypothetical protein
MSATHSGLRRKMTTIDPNDWRDRLGILRFEFISYG